MDNPNYYPVTIRLEAVEGEPFNGDELFVARCQYFPELMCAEGSPGKAYDGLLELITAVWWEMIDKGIEPPGSEHNQPVLREPTLNRPARSQR